MTLTVYILIAIPICILAILIWTYFDYRKYKREHHLIILLSLLFPTLSHAQYIDNENCRISFKSYENHQDKYKHTFHFQSLVFLFQENDHPQKQKYDLK